MTKKTKEAVKATAAIILALALAFAAWIYPLNQAGKIIVRPEEKVSAPDPAKSGLKGDSVLFISEDNQHLPGYIFRPEKVRGTVLLLHGLSGDLSSQFSKAKVLYDSGFCVIVYDQRGYGRSDGKMRSGGFFETNDLEAVVAKLELSDGLTPPVIIWGEEQGATAALRAWDREKRIDFVVAEEPVFNGRDWQKRIIKLRQMSAPDYYLGIIWWWMKIKSGYEMPLAETEISDAVGTGAIKRQGHMLLIACGSGDVPSNSYLADLKPAGGDWLILPCASGTSLFDSNRDKIISSVLGMVKK
jgi:uncharacterized protein